MKNRATIARPVAVRGVGLHTGQPVRLTVRPAAPGEGIVFIRQDLGGVEIPATHEHLARTSYATTLAADGASVSTVEHLLSAAVGLGIDDLRVELDGAEVPILDGSAAPFVGLLADAGRQDSGVPRQFISLEREVAVADRDKSITVRPGRGLRIHYSIDFRHPILGESEMTFDLKPRAYAREIAPARTFCRLEEVEALRRAGLARGGSLDNALVVDQDGLLNGPLRFSDEFVRHKILDLLGDLALLGAPLQGSIHVVRGGHGLHGQLVAALLARPSAWSLVPAHAGGGVPARRPPVAVPA